MRMGEISAGGRGRQRQAAAGALSANVVWAARRGTAWQGMAKQAQHGMAQMLPCGIYMACRCMAYGGHSMAWHGMASLGMARELSHSRRKPPPGHTHVDAAPHVAGKVEH